MRRGYFVVTLGAALAIVGIDSDARAQGGASAPAAASADVEVTLTREAPFDTWCVAPLCRADAQRRPALVTVPAFIAPNATEGLLGQQVKRALSDALESAAKATLGPAYNEAVADVAELYTFGTATCGDAMACLQVSATGTCVPYCNTTQAGHGCAAGKSCLQGHVGTTTGPVIVCVPSADGGTLDASHDAPGDVSAGGG